MKESSANYRPGLRVLRSGVYEVRHYEEHRAAHTGELLKGETFPYCRECKSRVRFHFKTGNVGTVSALVHDISFKEKTPPKATAASLFRAAFGRTMTSEEKSRIGNYKDNWTFRSK
jgi:hypothetical protein